MRLDARAACRGLVALVLDPTCAGCGGALPGLRGPLCPSCRSALEGAAGPACPACSLPLPGAEIAGACGDCRSLGARPPVAAPRAHEGLARRLVLALKSGRRPDLAETLARVTALDERVGAALRSADLLVPIPAQPLRKRERGYDQAELLARGLARQARGAGARPCVARVLTRRTGESGQWGRSRGERRRAPSRWLGSALLAGRRVSGRRVVLVDDVVTTGASLRAARRLLIGLGAADVYAVAVTRTGRAR